MRLEASSRRASPAPWVDFPGLHPRPPPPASGPVARETAAIQSDPPTTESISFWRAMELAWRRMFDAEEVEVTGCCELSRSQKLPSKSLSSGPKCDAGLF